jgi:DNA-binding SARP family transcriptional activator
VRTEAGELVIGAVRERTVLALLLLHPGESVTMQRLVDTVWDDEPPQNARNQIQGCVSRLRKQLAAAGIERQVIMTTADGYQVALGPQNLDLLMFRQLRDEARIAAASDELKDARDRYRSALRLWHGSVPGGIESPIVNRIGAALEEERAQALEERIEIDLAIGGAGELVAELTALVEQYPYREALHGALMRALYRAGRQAEALAAYRRVWQLLHDELGAEPGANLQQLHHAILSQDTDLEALMRTQRPATEDRLIPRGLPADVPGFTGRVDALAELNKLLPDSEPAAPRPVVISAIAGTAGVGKTALAIHWAHWVSGRFPDGQLYVNLRGFDPGQSPMEPAEAVRGFLDLLQVPPERIPVSIDAQAGLYRSLLADRRMLVVLDNARDASQVRPLLPGAPGCMVVVTSRNELSSLTATDGAHPLTLDLLSQDEARQLLARRLGGERLAAALEAADEIITRCARLPLALAIVAARAATRPELHLGWWARELCEAQSNLDVLSDPDPVTDLRAVLDVSYRTLSEDAARLFRLLGLHPGPDVSATAAASLAGLPVRQTRMLLVELSRAHLVRELTHGRYNFHDLLRSYAGELTNVVDTDEARQSAERRLHDGYLHTAYAGAMLIAPHREPITLDPPRPGAVTDDLGDHEDALEWFIRERSVLHAMIVHAASAGLNNHAWQLAWSLTELHQRQGRLHEFERIQVVALEAVNRTANSLAKAIAHRNLATTRAHLGFYEEAHTQLLQALEKFIEIGDRGRQARTHMVITGLLERQRRYEEAVLHAERVLALSRDVDDIIGQADALLAIGWYRAYVGHHQQALNRIRQALQMHQQAGDRLGQSVAWRHFGYVYRQLGDYPEATACWRRAVDLARDDANHHEEAMALIGLGDVYYAAGEPAATREAWQHAFVLLQGVDSGHADDVRAKLDQLTAGAYELHHQAESV